jgi:hypothetical protein
MDTPRALLERYDRAKDDVQPELMRDIYRTDAVLSYTIDTDAIAFPARTVGVEAITRTLVVDFSARFAGCKTYYVCDQTPRDDVEFASIPWLVVMREPAAQTLRIGKGYYEWRFEHDARGARVSAMHIHIHRMDAISDPQSDLMNSAQAQLPYPWLTPAVLRSTYQARAQRAELPFLHDFATPLTISSH